MTAHIDPDTLHMSNTMEALQVKSKQFVLTVEKFNTIMEYEASLKRGFMHPVMKKLGKSKQQQYDLDHLNSSQAFLGEEPLKGPSLDTYLKLIFKLSEDVGVEAQKIGNIDLNKVISDAKLPISSQAYATYYASGNLKDQLMAKWISNLLIIYAEVHREAACEDELTHTENQAQILAKKSEKAKNGRDIVTNSTSGVKRKRQVSFFCSVCNPFHNVHAVV